ncbi:10068_t:CDS:2 [Funneliformis geosporum]|uniref:10068_t:CDS:1 n=1 Tax=Funneliformis geosporum TaxID=1117311 RepID=A0A9W4SGN7_9GLOM|nr:10068_t:CDS:2 [Funneliformis geosporum]
MVWFRKIGFLKQRILDLLHLFQRMVILDEIFKFLSCSLDASYPIFISLSNFKNSNACAISDLNATAT